MNENSEYRNVHIAKHYLQLYLNSGKNLDAIRQIPLSEIDRSDVWQCVFESEPEAYRDLCKKTFYKDILLMSKCANNFIYRSIVMRLIQLEEWNTSFSVNDAIKVTMDCLGIRALPELIKEAYEAAEQRKQIIAPYLKKDTEWVSFAEKVAIKLKEYSKSNDYSYYANLIDSISIEWLQKNIHPFVPRDKNDTDRDYFRKMVLYAQAKNL